MIESTYIPRLSRLSAILIMLQAKRIITAGEIAKRFEISNEELTHRRIEAAKRNI